MGGLVSYQALLFDPPLEELEPAAPEFDGETLEPDDTPRLSGQLEVVLQALELQEWWSLTELTEFVEQRLGRRVSPTSISARLRDLRKKKFGGHTVDRRNEGNGLFLYRLGKGEPA